MWTVYQDLLCDYDTHLFGLFASSYKPFSQQPHPSARCIGIRVILLSNEHDSLALCSWQFLINCYSIPSSRYSLFHVACGRSHPFASLGQNEFAKLTCCPCFFRTTPQTNASKHHQRKPTFLRISPIIMSSHNMRRPPVYNMFEIAIVCVVDTEANALIFPL